MKRFLAVVMAALVIGAGSAGPMFAQNASSGHIRGAVTDSQGATIPNAAVTVTNVDTGVSQHLTTNGSGIYDAISLVVGRYNVLFNAPGFSSVEKTGVDVTLSGNTVDAQLSVGGTKEVVTVDSDTPLIKTESSEQSTTLESKTIEQLPDVGQDWANFTKILPGAAGSGQGVAVNGTLPFYTTFQADGANTQAAHSANVTTGVLETVAEVQIQTATFSAQTGSGGATFNQISKGGTNTFHGALYEYNENEYFSARNYFTRTGRKPVLRYNNFGGSVGGPVLHDKLFFYFNMDRILSSSPSTYNNTFPTAAARTGDFSDPSYPVIYDPATYDPSTGRRQQISCNGKLNVICPNRIDPVAAKINAFFPLPNLPGTSNNTSGSLTQTSPYKRYFGRLDYNIKQNNRFTISTAQGQQDNLYPNIACPLNCQAGYIGYYNLQATDSWTINSGLVNEFRYGYSRYNSTFAPFTLGRGYPAQLGLAYATGDSFPTINISGGVNGLGPGTFASYIQNSFDPSDVVTMIRGKHILHFGGELLRSQDNSTPWGAVDVGTFNFTGVYTQDQPNPAAGSKASGGYGYADFLLGQVQSYGSSNKARVGLRQWQPQAFLQDDIKLSPKLTLNAGIRYQAQTGWKEVHNRVGSFDPTLMNPATKTLGAIRFGGPLEKNVYNIFLPRIGFAWNLRGDGKTVIRGGYGLVAYGWSIDTYVGGTEGFGAFSQGSATAKDNINPVFLLSATNPKTNYVPASTSPSAYNNQGVPYSPYNTPVARNNQWTLSVQQQVPAGVVVEAAYVGSYAYNLSFPVDLNQVPASRQGQTAGSSNQQSLRPFPQFTSIQGNTFNANSNYHSLQLSANKRLSHGLSMDVNYTFSKLLDQQDSSGWGSRDGGQIAQDFTDPAANYGRSNFDIRHMFKGYTLYQLPFGRGRMFMNNNSLADVFLGGWQASTLFVLESGTPFTPLVGGPNTSGALAGNLFPNQIGNPVLSSRTTSKYFNTAAFAAPPVGTFGTLHRNTLQGPGLIGVDASLAKTLSLSAVHELFQLQIKMDAQNVLNHPNFSNPSPYFNQSDGGTITSTTNSYNSTNNSFGPRVIQLGARLSF